jgi:hypothetical protein
MTGFITVKYVRQKNITFNTVAFWLTNGDLVGGGALEAHPDVFES